MAWYDYITPVPKMFDAYIHPEKGYDEAAKRMKEAWQQSQGFQQPYNQAGQNQIGTLTSAENALLDPSKLLADWTSKYEMSPYAKQSLENSKQSGLDAASSMGLMGSSPAIQNIQNSASSIMNKDRSEFLKDLMQKYMTGINVGQNMFSTGASTAANLGQQRMGLGKDLGEMSYGSANAPLQQIGELMKLISLMQGGGSIGAGGA